MSVEVLVNYTDRGTFDDSATVCMVDSWVLLYSPNQVAEKVASRIAEGFSDTALIMVSLIPAAA